MKSFLPAAAIALISLLAAARGEWNLSLAGMAALAFCAQVWIGVSNLLPGMLLPRLLLADSAIQILALVLIDITGAPTVVQGMTGIPPDLAEQPLLVCGSQLLIPAGVLVASALVWLFARSEGFLPFARETPSGMALPMIACATLLLVRWFASAPALGYAGYILRGVSAPVAFTPFLMGWFARGLPAMRRICLPLLISSAAVGIAMGSREGMLYLAFYAAGVLFSLRGGARIRGAAIVIGAALPALYLASLIGIARHEVGRDSFDLLEPERLSRWFDVLEYQVSTRNAGDEEVLLNGIGRLFAWPNAVVVILSPDTVPNRGLAGLWNEARQLARLWGPSKEAADEFLQGGFGTLAARSYGFTVNASTSVEFGVLADGWSRAGPAGVVLCGGLLTLLLVLIERFAASTRLLGAAGKLVLFCVTANVILNVHVYSLALIGRALILNAAVFFLLAFGLSRLFPAKAAV